MNSKEIKSSTMTEYEDKIAVMVTDSSRKVEPRVDKILQEILVTDEYTSMNNLDLVVLLGILRAKVENIVRVNKGNFGDDKHFESLLNIEQQVYENTSRLLK